ncbi:MAG: HlyD family type I secretion periplasmic adaptor subunit [Parvularcula sp.]
MPLPTDTTNSALKDPLDPVQARASGIFVTTVALFFVVLMVWAGIAKVDRVTRGAGRIVSQERNSLVQHLEGGIIKQVLVKEGDHVSHGDVLMRIENSFAEAELASNKLALQTQELNRIRLLAEASGKETIDFSTLEGVSDELIAQQQRLFDTRQAEQRESLAVLDDQMSQRKLELEEKRSRLANKQQERRLVAERLESLRQLSQDGAVSRNELLQNETQYRQLLSQISDLEHQIPQTEAAIKESQSRRREAEVGFRADAERELTETEFEIAKLHETISALTDRSHRFDVTAPTDGTINKLYVNTLNGVVKPGQILAEVVPEDAPVEVEARIAPRDRGKVHAGLRTVVKVSAYDYTQFGGLEGKVIEVSPDALQDESGDIYFRVRIEADAAKLGDDNPVLPGMLAEVDIISGRQTVLDYLLRPVRAVSANAFRE